MPMSSAQLTHAMPRRCRAWLLSCSQPARPLVVPRLSALASRVAVCGVRAKQVLPLATQRAGRPRALCSGRCALLARCCQSAEAPPGESLPSPTPVAAPGAVLSDISGERLRRRERMSGNASFQRVYRSGRSFQLKHVRIHAMSNVDVEDVTCTRIGVVTAKKAHKRAVDRNLLRRRIKAVYRTNKDAFPDRADIVVTVNDTALEASYEELKQELLAWGRSVRGKALLAPRRPRRPLEVTRASPAAVDPDTAQL